MKVMLSHHVTSPSVSLIFLLVLTRAEPKPLNPQNCKLHEPLFFPQNPASRIMSQQKQ